jgi:hypothetical protein
MGALNHAKISNGSIPIIQINSVKLFIYLQGREAGDSPPTSTEVKKT